VSYTPNTLLHTMIGDKTNIREVLTMTRTKYLLQRIETLDNALGQSSVKNRKNNTLFNKILKPIIKEWKQEKEVCLKQLKQERQL